MGVLICLSASSEWYGSAIRALTKADVNHAFIAYTSKEWGGYWGVQTDERGVVKVPVENIKHKYVECYEFPDLDLATAMVPFRDFVGERYDWLGIFGFLIKLIAWRVFGRSIVNPTHGRGQQFCSEAVVRFLQKVDGMYDWVKVMDPSGVAPGGDREYLGVPSLQELLKEHIEIGEVRRVECPFAVKGVSHGNR